MLNERVDLLREDRLPFVITVDTDAEEQALKERFRGDKLKPLIIRLDETPT